MFSFFKKRLAIAEVDGITFFSSDTLERYLRKKEREEQGLHKYTVDSLDGDSLARCINMLECSGVFDYYVVTGLIFSTLYYYSKRPIIRIY